MSAPILWHISFSNFNEKARWALDYKRIGHVRREAPLGLHPIWAWRLGGGRTFPLLVLDGEAIGDSTRIADLTFAALIGSAVQPDGFPHRPREADRRGLPEMRSLLVERGVLGWIQEIYARHRGTWIRA